MITCVIDYTIDSARTADFERFAAEWIRDESGCVVRYERTFMRPFLG